MERDNWQTREVHVSSIRDVHVLCYLKNFKVQGNVHKSVYI